MEKRLDTYIVQRMRICMFKGGMVHMPTFDGVNVTGDLTVDGKTQLGNSSTDVVTVAGNETVQGNLTVNGNVQLGSSAINSARITGNLSVSGNTQLGTSVIDSVQIAGNLTVNGNTQLGRTATDTVNIAGNETIQGNLSVNGNTQLGNAPSDTLSVSGNESVQGDLTVNGDTHLGNKSGTNTVKVYGDLAVLGDTQLEGLEVNGKTQLGNGPTDTVNINGQGFVAGSLAIDGTLIVNEYAQLGNTGSEKINIVGELENTLDGTIKVQPKNNLAFLGAGNGIILTAPNKSCWLLTVDNNGNLMTTHVQCPSK